MKTKALQLSLLIISLAFLSFTDPYSIKRISDKEYRYEFYTTSKVIKPKADKVYYWFKGGIIHNAQYGISGELIDGKFVKMYHSNQLAEQGFLKKGIKVGLWKSWHKNGNIETTQKWNSGFKSGDFYRYNENGELIEKGKFKKDKKHGIWIDYIKKDSVFYKKGTVLILKEKKAKDKLNRRQKERNDLRANEKSKNTTEKKNFVKRIFSKKQPKEKVNGQGA